MEVIVRPLDIYQTKFSVCGLARTHTLAMPITLSAFIRFAHLTRPSHTHRPHSKRSHTKVYVHSVYRYSTLHTYLQFNFLVFVVCDHYFISAAVRSMFFPTFILFRIHNAHKYNTFKRLLFFQSFVCARTRENERFEGTIGTKPNAYTQMCSHIKWQSERFARSYILNFDHSVVRELWTKKVNTPICSKWPVEFSVCSVSFIFYFTSLDFLISNICANSNRIKTKGTTNCNRSILTKKRKKWFVYQSGECVNVREQSKYKTHPISTRRSEIDFVVLEWPLANYFWCVFLLRLKDIHIDIRLWSHESD